MAEQVAMERRAESGEPRSGERTTGKGKRRTENGERRTENWLPHYGIQFSVLRSQYFVLRLLEA